MRRAVKTLVFTSSVLVKEQMYQSSKHVTCYVLLLIPYGVQISIYSMSSSEHR